MKLKLVMKRIFWALIPESWGNRYQRWSIDRTFREKRAELIAKNADRDEFMMLEADEYSTWQQIEEDIGRTRAKKLWSSAGDLDIELPRGDKSMWQTTDDGEVTFLNTKGRAYVRKLVHEEKMRSLDLHYGCFTKIIIPLLGLLVGLGGLFISYLALRTKNLAPKEKPPATFERVVNR
jgi:hypothetical protein